MLRLTNILLMFVLALPWQMWNAHAPSVETTDLTIDGTSRVMSGSFYYKSVNIINHGKIIVAPYNGDDQTGKLIIKADSIFIDHTSAIIGNGAGYRGTTSIGEGPGGGGKGRVDGGGGGGYGGEGGCGVYDQRSDCDGYGGKVYGEVTGENLEMGSAGGAGMDAGPGGNGGAAIWLAANTITIHGIIQSNGENGPQVSNDGTGGGSGGEILLAATYGLTLDGTLTTNGGDGGLADDGGGGGGGGRIKVFYGYGSLGGTFLANGGIGDGNGKNNNGKQGTTYGQKPLDRPKK